jgi:starch synthase
MDILLVASEFAPWIQHTGVAEVVASFSKTLKQVGHTVTVLVPYRSAYDQSGLLLARRLSKLKLGDAGELPVYDTQLTSGVQLVLVDLGVDDQTPFGLREAVLLAQAVAAIINDRSNMGAHTDIVHVHDWLGSFVALAIEQVDGPRPPTVVTLHDGIQMPQLPDAQDKSALGPFASASQAFLGERINLAAVAVRTAKGVITPSHEHARQLTDPAYSGSLAEELRSLAQPVLGIPAGVDYSRANPAIDPQLPSRFDAENSSPKTTCKGSIQKQVGLESDLMHPLLFIAAPLRGVQGQAICDALPRLLDYSASIVVALQPGDDSAFVDQVRAVAEQWKSRIALLPLSSGQPYTPALGAADLVLLGAASSPLDSYHLFALRYGAVPITDLAGVHADVLLDCDAKLQTGNCFALGVWDADQVLGTIARAISAWDQPGFERLRRRIMRQDLGWERPTRRAIQLYRQVLGIKV